MQTHIVQQPSTVTSKTISNTTTVLATIGSDTTAALISVATNDVYMTWDGTVPTAVNGLRLPKDNLYSFDGRDLLSAMRFYASSDAWVTIAEIKGR